MKDLQSIFTYFAMTEFLYDYQMGDHIWAQMSDQDRQQFPCDVRRVDWEKTF